MLAEIIKRKMNEKLMHKVNICYMVPGQFRPRKIAPNPKTNPNPNPNPTSGQLSGYHTIYPQRFLMSQ